MGVEALSISQHNPSGKHRGETKISKRGCPELRSLLYKASLTLVAKNKEFKALYNYFLKRREIF